MSVTVCQNIHAGVTRPCSVYTPLLHKCLFQVILLVKHSCTVYSFSFLHLKVPTDEEMTYTLNYSSKMEKEIMANALDKHRAGIIRKQIAAGREFRGCAFVSKPCNVQFKVSSVNVIP